MAAHSHLPSIDENELFQRAKAGDKDAAQRLFDLHEGEFRGVIRKHLADRVRPLHDSFDLLQETRLALVENPFPDKIDSPRELLAYLCTIARNKARSVNRDHLVCQKRSRLREMPLEKLQENQEPTTDLTTHEELEAKYHFIRSSLRKRQQADLRLLRIFTGGMTVEQIAAKIRFPVAFVEKCLERARKLEAEKPANDSGAPIAQ